MEFLLGFFAIGIVLAPLIIALVNRTTISRLIRRIEQLEFSLQRQNATIEDLQRRIFAKPASAESESLPKVERSPVVPITFEAPIPGPPPSGARTPVVVSMSPAPELIVKPKSRTSKEWEALIGGKVLNRIGALALIIGVGFFLKYAFDNDLISETLRVILGALAGAGLLLGAARMHKKHFEIFAQGLVGAGISILYLSVYAAFNFYHLIPQVVAFVLMSAVTMLTLWQALAYNSLAVALLGWAGGFLTPFLLSTGEPNAVGLFTYLALLVAGLLAIVLSKEKWFILEPLTMAATYFVYFLWFDGAFKPELRITAIFFVTLFWVLFFAIEAVRNLRNVANAALLRHALAVANGALYYIAIYQLFEPEHHAFTGLVTLLIGVPYFAMFVVLMKRMIERNELRARYVLAAIIFLFSATAIQFSGFMTVTLWSLEALVVAYAGLKWNMKSVWIAAVAMFATTFFKLFFSEVSWSYIPLEEFRPLLTMRAAAFLTLGATLFLSAGQFRQREEKLAGRFSLSLSYLWCFVLLVFLAVETADLFNRWMLYVEGDPHRFLSFKQVLTIGMVWMAYSVALAWYGFRRDDRPALYSSIVTLALALGVGGLRSLAYSPIESYGFIFNYRVLAMAVLIAGSVTHYFLWKKSGSAVRHSTGLLETLSVAIVLVIFFLLTTETYDGFGSLLLNASGDRAEMLFFKRILTLALVWTAYSLALTWFGLSKQRRAATYFGITVMVLGLFVGLFRSLWYDPVEWFFPFFNYRFVVMCLLIAGAALQLRLWRTNGRDVAWSKTLATYLGLMVVALVLALLTSETRDYFEKQIHITQRIMGDNWTHEFEAQLSTLRNLESLSLSGVWLVYSVVLMVVGIWKRYRNLRFVAIGLFGISILKIFIYDLSFLQTLYRIFSFMGLGVILLGVSYLYQKYKGIILEGEEKEKESATA